jgi:hypothetical protein
MNNMKVILLKSVPWIKKWAIDIYEIGDDYIQFYSLDKYCYEIGIDEAKKRKSWFLFTDK